MIVRKRWWPRGYLVNGKTGFSILYIIAIGGTNINSLLTTTFTEWLHRDFLEIAALAQHDGIPSRPIDWSYNPYTAAFFASNSKRKYKKDEEISIWLLIQQVHCSPPSSRAQSVHR
ncbi:FRG domain-containing protein [Erwinia piriflorinigrans]|uniref:FRG domain-containing protein n=1 Tax=Erwinia piriflorinigrans TaxID=665097 RepID=UPI0009080CDA